MLAIVLLVCSDRCLGVGQIKTIFSPKVQAHVRLPSYLEFPLAFVELFTVCADPTGDREGVSLYRVQRPPADSLATGPSSSYTVVPFVKSGSSGLKSDGGSGREIEVSYRGGPEVQQRYKSGDLVRTWRRLMCHALAKVIVLDFRGTEVQRYGGEQRHEGGLQVRGWET